MRAGWRAGPSSQPPNPGLPGSFEDGDKDRLPADLVVRLLTLFASQLDKRLIGHRLHKPVAQKTQGQPGCADIFAVRQALLDLGVGKRSIGTDGAIIHQGASGDDLGSARDGDLRVLKTVLGPLVSHAQRGGLAAPAGYGALLPSAAGLRVI